jgi:lipopolysaccharide export system protein LptC
MTNARVLAYVLLLGAVALVTQWLLWLERPGDRGDTFVGPPRSDYVALDYVLVARDKEGAFAFSATGPRAVRHPFLGSFDLETPHLRFHDGEGNDWDGDSKTGWVSKDGAVVKLAGAVELRRAARTEPRTTPLTIKSEHLTTYTDRREVESDDPVTIAEPGSILRGTGMRAQLKQQHLELKSSVSLRHDPKTRAVAK